MIVLDTNVLSEVMRPAPDRKALAWLDRQPRMSIWTTSITVLEIRFGLQMIPAGRRRSALAQAVERLLEAIAWRVAPFDTVAARHAGELMASRPKRGRPGELRDTMIAGIVLARHATLATRNADHFADLPVPVVDPWGVE